MTPHCRGRCNSRSGLSGATRDDGTCIRPWPSAHTSLELRVGGLYGTNQVDLALFATEMVYIPDGAFYIGDGTVGAPYGQFYQYPNVNQPFLVTNENAITTGTAIGN